MGEIMSKIKEPKTIEEQLNILKSRNVIIDDVEKGKYILERLNYYRLSAYLLPFKQANGTYKDGTSLSNVYDIYEFDRKLRSLILSVLEEIEIILRTQLAYYHSCKYCALAYTNSEMFNRSHKHEDFLSELNKQIANNSDNLFVNHHKNRYAGVFPLWVAVELFTFGMTTRFYTDMLENDMDAFAKSVFNIPKEHLRSWLICLTMLRNRCAHYTRIYYFNFNKLPKTFKNSPQHTRKVFDLIFTMKYLYKDTGKWRSGFLAELQALIEQYEDSINMCHIGFPYNWHEILYSDK